MEWMVGDNPSDLISISSKELIDHGFKYSERQKSDAKRRLLDMVCNKWLHCYPHFFAHLQEFCWKSCYKACQAIRELLMYSRS